MKLMVPFIIMEVGSQEHLDLRLITSLIRHNTMIYKPIILYVHQFKALNIDEVVNEFRSMLKMYRENLSGISTLKKFLFFEPYIPLGYESHVD